MCIILKKEIEAYFNTTQYTYTKYCRIVIIIIFKSLVCTEFIFQQFGLLQPLKRLLLIEVPDYCQKLNSIHKYFFLMFSRIIFKL